ncbi:MAG: tRNA (adenosine(37)-N6)-threonylcarbamoyltransferase complex transferase subunit TsaD, partial [Clostridiaceae bacterium]|nr:tRNA (adenosine(37)-N6)-threonylcarbamoyltransferase complex transferase subunit TsaD [Clostridiaceae bacterium]
MDKGKATRILGIETSCDETAASVVTDGRLIESSIVASQVDLHAEYGGVVPEIASREHVKTILPVVDRALKSAGAGLEDMDAIAVTYGPGLVGALLVGVAAAKGLASATGLALVPVHHLEGHIASAYLADPSLQPPFLCLIVSGGHATLVEVDDYTVFHVLGRTRDDAPGEAFDKIARTIGLGYPGGPLIEQAAAGGDREAFSLPVTHFPDSFDFSFSGVKTAAINRHHQLMQEAEKEGTAWPSSCSLNDFAATFQETVVQTLVSHTKKALVTGHFRSLVMAGGVSANKELREAMAAMADGLGVRLTIPALSFCTDNAAMIASAGFYAWRSGRRAGADLNAYPMADLE